MRCRPRSSPALPLALQACRALHAWPKAALRRWVLAAQVQSRHGGHTNPSWDVTYGLRICVLPSVPVEQGPTVFAALHPSCWLTHSCCKAARACRQTYRSSEQHDQPGSCLRAGDSFTFASTASRTTTTAPAARTVSPFASAAAPPLPPPQAHRPRAVVGELSHLFEGTTRRGRPRGLSALSAPAVVSRPSTPGMHK